MGDQYLKEKWLEEKEHGHSLVVCDTLKHWGPPAAPKHEWQRKWLGICYTVSVDDGYPTEVEGP